MKKFLFGIFLLLTTTIIAQTNNSGFRTIWHERAATSGDTTSTLPPEISNWEIQNLTQTSITPGVWVDTRDLATTVTFLYGVTPGSYVDSVTTEDYLFGTDPRIYYTAIYNLKASTTYYYKWVATNVNGRTEMALEGNFTTLGYSGILSIVNGDVEEGSVYGWLLSTNDGKAGITSELESSNPVSGSYSFHSYLETLGLESDNDLSLDLTYANTTAVDSQYHFEITTRVDSGTLKYTGYSLGEGFVSYNHTIDVGFEGGTAATELILDNSFDEAWDVDKCYIYDTYFDWTGDGLLYFNSDATSWMQFGGRLSPAADSLTIESGKSYLFTITVDSLVGNNYTTIQMSLLTDVLNDIYYSYTQYSYADSGSTYPIVINMPFVANNDYTTLRLHFDNGSDPTYISEVSLQETGAGGDGPVTPITETLTVDFTARQVDSIATLYIDPTSKFYATWDDASIQSITYIDSIVAAPLLTLTSRGVYDSLLFSWNTDAEIGDYEFYTSSTSSTSGFTLDTTLTATQRLIIGLSPGSRRWAKVRGIDTSGTYTSNFSNTVYGNIIDTTTYDGTNWYISSISGADISGNNAHSPANAWASLKYFYQNGYSSLSPKDTVFLEGELGGERANPSKPAVFWIGANSISGAEGAYIVFTGYGEGVTINHGSEYRLFMIEAGNPYISLENMTFNTDYSKGVGVYLYPKVGSTGSDATGWTGGIHHLKLKNINFQNNWLTNYGQNAWYKADKNSGFTDVNGNGVFDGGIDWFDSTYTTHAAPMYNIWIEGCRWKSTRTEDAISLIGPGDNFTFINNIILDAQEEAFDLQGGSGHLIEGNFVSGSHANGFKFHSQYGDFQNSIIRNNIILVTGYGNSSWSGGDGLTLTNISNCIVENNLVYSRYAANLGERDRGWKLYTDVPSVPDHYVGYHGWFHSNIIRNNIFIGVSQIKGDWYNGNNPDSLRAKNTFRNNIWYKGTQDFGDLPASSTCVRNWSYGETVTNWTPSQWNTTFVQYNTGSLTVSPQFINEIWTNFENYGDFRLKSTSPAVNAGYTTVDNDVENAWNYILKQFGTALPRPTGAGTDIGPHEYDE